MNTIAIDCGASFIKCALFDDEILITSEQITAPPVGEGASIFSTDRIECLINIVRNKLRILLSNVQEAVLCIDNEMHGFILAYPDGTPYTDYISWQLELISADIVREHLTVSVGETKTEETLKRTGMSLRSGLPSSTLLWMNRNGYLAEQGELRFYTLGDYIIKRITRKEPICHPTNAASTGLYDLEKKDWNREYISLLTDNANIVFPSIGNSVHDMEYDNKAIHVLPAIGDQQAALLGSGFHDTCELSINMGTGAQVSRLIRKDIHYGNYQIRPYFYDCYLRTIPHVPSGRAINVFFRFIKDICKKVNPDIEDEKVWKIIHDSVSETAMSEEKCLSCDLSFFENAITEHKSGSISNISEYGLNLENLISSVFRQMTDNFILTANTVNDGLPEYNTLIFSGGMAKRWDVLRNSIVKGLHSDAKVILSDNDTLFGCMKYAMMSIGDR